MTRTIHVEDPTGRYDLREAHIEGGTGTADDPYRLSYVAPREAPATVHTPGFGNF